MLYASKAELESATRVQMLTIQMRELEFFLTACNYIAQLSALVAGFAYTALIYTKYIDADLCDPQEILCAEMNYPVVLTITMGTSMYCLWGAMLVGFLAPALALKGLQGSVQECLHIVVQEYQCLLFVFMLAVVMIMVSTILWSMTQHQLPGSVVVIVLVCLLTLYLMYLTTLRALARFDFPGRFGFPTAVSAGMSQRQPTQPPSAGQSFRVPQPPKTPAHPPHHGVFARAFAYQPLSEEDSGGGVSSSGSDGRGGGSGGGCGGSGSVGGDGDGGRGCGSSGGRDGGDGTAVGDGDGDGAGAAPRAAQMSPAAQQTRAESAAPAAELSDAFAASGTSTVQPPSPSATRACASGEGACAGGRLPPPSEEESNRVAGGAAVARASDVGGGSQEGSPVRGDPSPGAARRSRSCGRISPAAAGTPRARVLPTTSLISAATAASPLLTRPVATARAIISPGGGGAAAAVQVARTSRVATAAARGSIHEEELIVPDLIEAALAQQRREVEALGQPARESFLDLGRLSARALNPSSPGSTSDAGTSPSFRSGRGANRPSGRRVSKESSESTSTTTHERLSDRRDSDGSNATAQ